MNNKNKKTNTIRTIKKVGIIGGMGPESTLQLMRKVIKLTPARREQDHIRMLVDNRPEIPDRTEFILGKGPSPVSMLTESARLLEQAGADFLAIACNTAHHFIEEVQNSVTVPVLNMLALTANYLREYHNEVESVGLLATTGSIHLKLFDKYMINIKIIKPHSELQQHVMEAIYGVKGIKTTGIFPENKIKIVRVADELRLKGAKLIIAGCTETGLALEGQSIGVPVINPLHVLAKEIVRRAKI